MESIPVVVVVVVVIVVIVVVIVVVVVVDLVCHRVACFVLVDLVILGEIIDLQ